MSTKQFTSGTGRRKTGVARVFLYEGAGEVTVNDVPIEQYFPTEKETLAWQKPFHLISVSHPKSKYGVSIKVVGSGKPSQLDAVVLGISRALSKINAETRVLLKKNGLLTRDPRMVERKKYYLRKARKAPQYSKR